MIKLMKQEFKKKYFVVEVADHKDMIALYGPMSPKKAKDLVTNNNLLYKEGRKATYSTSHTGGYIETMLNSSYYNHLGTLETEINHLLEQ